MFSKKDRRPQKEPLNIAYYEMHPMLDTLPSIIPQELQALKEIHDSLKDEKDCNSYLQSNIHAMMVLKLNKDKMIAEFEKFKAEYWIRFFDNHTIQTESISSEANSLKFSFIKDAKDFENKINVMITLVESSLQIIKKLFQEQPEQKNQLKMLLTTNISEIDRDIELIAFDIFFASLAILVKYQQWDDSINLINKFNYWEKEDVYQVTTAPLTDCINKNLKNLFSNIMLIGKESKESPHKEKIQKESIPCLNMLLQKFEIKIRFGKTESLLRAAIEAENYGFFQLLATTVGRHVDLVTLLKGNVKNKEILVNFILNPSCELSKEQKGSRFVLTLYQLAAANQWEDFTDYFTAVAEKTEPSKVSFPDCMDYMHALSFTECRKHIDGLFLILIARIKKSPSNGAFIKHVESLISYFEKFNDPKLLTYGCIGLIRARKLKEAEMLCEIIPARELVQVILDYNSSNISRWFPFGKIPDYLGSYFTEQYYPKYKMRIFNECTLAQLNFLKRRTKIIPESDLGMLTWYIQIRFKPTLLSLLDQGEYAEIQELFSSFEDGWWTNKDSFWHQAENWQIFITTLEESQLKFDNLPKLFAAPRPDPGRASVFYSVFTMPETQKLLFSKLDQSKRFKFLQCLDNFQIFDSEKLKSLVANPDMCKKILEIFISLRLQNPHPECLDKKLLIEKLPKLLDGSATFRTYNNFWKSNFGKDRDPAPAPVLEIKKPETPAKLPEVYFSNSVDVSDKLFKAVRDQFLSQRHDDHGARELEAKGIKLGTFLTKDNPNYYHIIINNKPLMPKGILALDLDDTLLTKSYNYINEKLIKECIDSALAKGYLVVCITARCFSTDVTHHPTVSTLARTALKSLHQGITDLYYTNFHSKAAVLSYLSRTHSLSKKSICLVDDSIERIKECDDSGFVTIPVVAGKISYIQYINEFLSNTLTNNASYEEYLKTFLGIKTSTALVY